MNISYKDIVNRFEIWRKKLDEHVSSTSQKATAIAIGTTLTLIVSRLFWKKLKSKRNAKTPPQLLGLPFVGSLFTLLFYKEKYFHELLPKYGDIVKYNLGPLQCYTISNVELLNKVLQKASMRPQIFTDSVTRHDIEVHFLAVNDDRDWTFRRKTIMRHLNLIMNSKKLDEIISNTLKETLFKELELYVNEKKLWYPRKYTKNLAFNMIFLAMYGRILDVNSKRFTEYVDTITYVVKYHPITEMYDFFPSFIANYFFGEIDRTWAKSFRRGMQLAEEDINDMLKQLNNNNNNNNNNKSNDLKSEDILVSRLWDIYKQHKHIDIDSGNNKNNSDEENQSLGMKRLVADHYILTLAGMDTTGHAMEVGILLLAKYPKIQEIVYGELKNVANSNNNNSDDNDSETLISLSKLNECAQFRAFIGETLRIATSVPQGLPHTADKDLRCMKFKNGKIICDFIDSNIWHNIDGKSGIEYDYIIEANSFIDLNLVYINECNKEIWNLDNDPMTVNLNYWLVKDEKSGKLTFKNNSNSIPFNVGSRQCAGIALAMKEMTALMANLILNYKIIAQNNDADSVDLKFHTFAAATTSVEPEIAVLVSKR